MVKTGVLLLSFLGVLNAAVISLGPVSGPVIVGQTFTVPVTVAGVLDLYAASFSIGFDPTRLEFVGQSEGSFLSLGSPTTFIPGSVSVGAVSDIAVSLLGSTPGATGSGTLADLDFRALAAGTANLTVYNFTLLDSSVSGIDTTGVGITIDITASEVPEPATWAGVASAMFVLICFRLSQHS